ncbi:hypothetical protein ACF0H5_019860 [Mactra antiquata]
MEDPTVSNRVYVAKIQDNSYKLVCTYKYLRSLNSLVNETIDQVNNDLQGYKLINTERLTIRLQCESRRLSSQYKKLKGGRNKTKFDTRLIQMELHEQEIEDMTLIPEANSEGLINNGLRVDNSSKSHKQRVLKKLEESSGKAQSYGVIPKKVVCETLDYKLCTIHVDSHDNTPRKCYDDMTSYNRESVKDVLNLCDSFMVSDAAYHELAMRYSDLPRKSHIASCRQELNSAYNIHRSP